MVQHNQWAPAKRMQLYHIANAALCYGQIPKLTTLEGATEGKGGWAMG